MSRTGQTRFLEVLAAALLPLVPALLACFRITDGDTGFHVATGRAIEMLGEVPTTNVLSFAQPDQPWVLHQWIPALLFYKLDALAGPAGLIALKCSVVYLTFLFLWLAIRDRQGYAPAARPAALLLFGLAAGAAASRFLVRPFLFSDLGLAILLLCVARMERPGKGWAPWAAVLVCGVTATLHAGAVYLLLVTAALAAAHGIAWLAGRRGIVLPDMPPARFRTALAAPAGALVLAVAAVSVESPWGLKALLLPFQFSANEYYHQHLAEFRPLPLDLALYPFAWALLLATWALAIAALRAERKSLSGASAAAQRLFELLLLAGFTWLVLKHQRIVFDAALVLAFLAARFSLLLHGPAASHRWFAPTALFASVAVGAAALVVQFSAAQPGVGLDERFYPKRIFRFVAEQDLPEHAYVSDAWGGHWLWEFYPRRRVFYDNRLEAYSFDFYRNVYQSIRYGEPGWQEKLDSHGINTLVLRYSTPGEREFQKGAPNIRDLAFASDRWRLVFWDDLGMVFVRTPATDRGCAGCRTLDRFNPDTMQAVDTALVRDVEEELRNVWQQIPSARSCLALSSLLYRAGRSEEAGALLAAGLRQFPGVPFLEDFALRLAASPVF
jgi:hypothetical protein